MLRSSWITSTAKARRCVMLSAGSMLPSSTHVRAHCTSGYIHDLLLCTIMGDSFTLFWLSSLALSRDTRQGRDKFLLSSRQRRQLEDGHHSGWQWKSGQRSHQGFHLVCVVLLKQKMYVYYFCWIFKIEQKSGSIRFHNRIIVAKIIHDDCFITVYIEMSSVKFIIVYFAQ